MEQRYNDVKTPSFTKSELRIVELLARGCSEKEVASMLCLSQHTVNNHVRNIREKNGLAKNTEVIILYIAYLRKGKFSLKALKEIGITSVLLLVDICKYTGTNW